MAKEKEAQNSVTPAASAVPLEPVVMETLNLCGFQVPVFRGARAIPDDVVKKLKVPLPAGAISPNNDPKKSGMSSIKSIYIVERFNEVFGLGEWAQLSQFVEVVPKPADSKKGDSIVVKSILLVPKYGIYFEAYGGNDNYDRGDAWKGACTDALTKMASFLYVGMDVFKGHPETSTLGLPSKKGRREESALSNEQGEQAAVPSSRPAATADVASGNAPGSLICADCTGEITAFKSGDKEYSAESVAATAQKRYAVNLCSGCQKKRKAAQPVTPAAAAAQQRLSGSDNKPGAVQ